MENPHDLYWDRGYHIWRSLIPETLIDPMMKAYREQIVPSEKPFIREDTNHWEIHQQTAEGFVVQPLLDVHGYDDFPEFGTAVKDLLGCEPMREALETLSENKFHRLVQSTMIDAEWVLQGQQDSYFIDSWPNGQLIGAFIALEDIEPQACRLYVVSESHRIDFDTVGDVRKQRAAHLTKIDSYLRSHSTEVVTPVLFKGDVVFWNSNTIHGTKAPDDPRLSSKGLSAHYLPARYKLGSRFWEIEAEYVDYKGMLFRRQDRDLSRLLWTVFDKFGMAGLYDKLQDAAYAREIRQRKIQGEDEKKKRQVDRNRTRRI